MLKFQQLFQVSLLLTLAIAAASCRTPEQASSTPAEQNMATDEAAIRAEVVATEAAINRRDFAGFAAQFTPDGDAIIVDSPRISGHDAIRRTFETGWADAPANRQITITVGSIRFLSDDIAVVDNRARFSAGEPTQDRATAVMVRRDGGWRIAALRILPAAKE